MVITSNVNILIEHGLGERGESNFRLVHDTCNTLLKIAPTKTSTTDPEPPFRYPLDHELFLRLEKLLTDGFDKLEDQHYIPMIQQSIAVIYQLSETIINRYANPTVLNRSLISKWLFKESLLNTCFLMSRNYSKSFKLRDSIE